MISRESPRGVVDNVLEFNIVVGGFELNLLKYVHFYINALGKGMNPLWVK